MKGDDIGRPTMTARPPPASRRRGGSSFDNTRWSSGRPIDLRRSGTRTWLRFGLLIVAILLAVVTTTSWPRTDAFQLQPPAPVLSWGARSGVPSSRNEPPTMGSTRVTIRRAGSGQRRLALRAFPVGSDKPYHRRRRRRRRLPNGEYVERRKKPRLGLLTFDLDDTLFPTSIVVQHANQRMVEFLNAEGYATTVEDYLASARAIRTQWQHQRTIVVTNITDRVNEDDDDDDDDMARNGVNARPDDPTSARLGPLSYTELRKRAIRSELQRLTNNPYRTYDDVVHEAYELWEHERHAAAEYYLDPSVVDALHHIKKHFGQHLCVAAITNGKGNPLKMPSLAPFFSFCVSGEDDHVFPHRKPHPQIFQVALNKFRAEHYQPNDDDDDDDEATVVDNANDFLWCHVGDCLANDVGASADCGAFAVWYCPNPDAVTSALAASGDDGTGGMTGFLAAFLAHENGDAHGGAAIVEAPQTPELRPGWSTATQEELNRRNELAGQAAQDKVSAHIYHISQLPDVLKQVARPDRRAKLQRRRQ